MYATEVRELSGIGRVVVHYPKSRVTAAALALFLGGLGIHKFYLNRPGLGLLYLLFCWTFVPAIVGFIEALVYLSMSDEAFQQQYGQT
jgi:TM2 domain-containing membrane protein YozV